MCDITAITSGKGGTGKTMFASNIACLLAMNNKKVLLVDMNTGMRNLDISLGLENQVIFDIADVITGICPLRKAIVRDTRFPALYLMSAPQICGKTEIKSIHLQKIFEIMSGRFDYIIIDAPSGMCREWKTAVSQADKVVLLLTQEFSSIRSTDSIDNNLLKMGIKRRFAVVNRVKAEYSLGVHFPSLTDISENLKADVAGVIQEETDIHVGMNCGIPTVYSQADTKLIKNLTKISNRIFADEN